MIWLVRAALSVVLVCPFIGSFLSISDAAKASSDQVGLGEVELVFNAVLFSGLISIVQLYWCGGIIALVFFNREGPTSLAKLVTILSVLFLVPPALRARAFDLFWSHLGLGPGDLLFLIWSLTYNTVFFWAAALVFLQSERHRSAAEALRELTTGPARGLAIARMLAPVLAGAGIASFVITLMSGRELRILTTNRYPLGAVLADLFGGRDRAAALLCGALTLALMAIMGGATWYATASNRTIALPWLKSRR